MLDNWNEGSGRLLLQFASKLMEHIKGYTKDWTYLWFSDMRKLQGPARQNMRWFTEAMSNKALQEEASEQALPAHGGSKNRSPPAGTQLLGKRVAQPA